MPCGERCPLTVDCCPLSGVALTLSVDFYNQGDGGEQFDKNIGGCPQKSVILLG